MSDQTQDDNGYIAAIFETVADADAAVTELEREHFPRESIGMAFPETEGVAAFRREETADPGTRVAVTVGGAGAGYPGWTMGMAPWVFPGVGPVVVIGSIARAQRPDGPDDLRGFIMSLGLHEDVFGHLEAGFKRGAVLVGVDARGNDAIAKNILERNGGHVQRRQAKSTEENNE